MGKVSRLGNALYEGDVSIDFVGRKWLWYSISGVIVLLAVGGLLLQGPQPRHRVRGRHRVQRVRARAGEATQDNADKIRDAVAGDRASRTPPSPIVNTSGTDAITVQTEVADHRRSPTPSSQAITDDGRRRPRGHLRGRRRAELGRAGRPAGADRPDRLPGAGGALHLGVLPRVEDVRRRARGAGPRRADHGRRLRAVRLRGHAGDGHRPADDPRVLAVRHGGRLRQGAREHQEPARAAARRTPKAANLAVNQTLVRSINTSIVALLPIGAILYVGVGHARLRRAQGPRAGAVRRHGGRCLLLDLHRDPAGRAAEVGREGGDRRRASRAGAREAHRRPLRRGAGVRRGHAGRSRAGCRSRRATTARSTPRPS